MKTIVNYAQKVKEQHALNKTIAPVETDLTSASKAYAVGQKFIHDGVLYQAKTAIAQGAALVLNTNYEAADDVSTEIEALTNKLNNEIVTRSALGAKNLLNNTASTKTENGVTYTVNSDKSVTFSGTATDFSGLALCSNQKFKAGKYILSGIFGSTGLDVVNIKWDYLSLYDASNTLVRTINLGNETDAELVIDLTNDVFDNITLALKRNNNTACSGTAYPMLRLYEDKGTEYQPYAKTNQQLTAENQTLTKYANAQSNPNLLDNPWFTVNQRGLSNFVNAQYGVDRWKFNVENTPTIEFTNNGIEISDYVSGNIVIYQPLESDLIDSSKDYTISIMASDSSILSSKLNTTGSLSYMGELAGARFFHQLVELSGVPEIEIFVNALTTNLTIRAVKIELGEVSTLASDTAPNYATELAKCQRYYQCYKLKSNYAQLDNGRFNNDHEILMPLSLPTALRAQPTVSITNLSSLSVYSNNNDTISSITLGTSIYNSDDVVKVCLVVTTAGTNHTKGDTALIAGTGDVATAQPVIALSADL